MFVSDFFTMISRIFPWHQCGTNSERFINFFKISIENPKTRSLLKSTVTVFEYGVKGSDTSDLVCAIQIAIGVI
jgi:hypothetical protein